MMIVMKFGGTSIGNAPAIRRVCGIIKSRSNLKPLVVVSAMAGVTNKLVDLHRAFCSKKDAEANALLAWLLEKHLDVIKELGLEGGCLDKSIQSRIDQIAKTFSGITIEDEKPAYDKIVSTGELLSSEILSEFCRNQGMNTQMSDSRAFIQTDSKYGSAKPAAALSKKPAQEKLLPLIQAGIIPIVQGFIGKDRHGQTTTIGRGGSDLTATFLASLLKADIVEIWSDVNGVMTADPSIVPKARRIHHMSYREAAELAYFGARVLHPATMLPAVESRIPVHVLNTFNPDEGSSVISVNEHESAGIVKSIAYKENITVITITSTRMLMAYGFLASIFAVFDRYHTAVDLVTTSEVSVSLTIDSIENLNQIVEELSRFSHVSVESGKAIVCVAGEGMKVSKGIAASIFNVIKDVPVNLISQGASEINLSFVINECDIKTAVKQLHHHFFEQN